MLLVIKSIMLAFQNFLHSTLILSVSDIGRSLQNILVLTDYFCKPSRVPVDVRATSKMKQCS